MAFYHRVRLQVYGPRARAWRCRAGARRAARLGGDGEFAWVLLEAVGEAGPSGA